MTITTTTAVISNASTATMNTWIAEICNAIFTTLGVTQTADTGQVWAPNTATGTLPGGAHGSAGYVIGRFNDAAQGAAPIYFKLEFGTGNAVASPFMWITLGTASNGSGTLTNPSVRVACGADYAWPVSTSTTYTSYFCYNTTYGFLGVVLKMGSVVSSADLGVAGMGFMIFRGSTSTGAVNTDATCLLTAASTNTGPTGIAGSANAASCMQCWSVSKAAYYPATSDSVNDGVQWVMPPLFGYAGFVSGFNPTIWPAFYLSPQPSISNLLGLVNCSDVSVGTSFSAAILGSTTLTYINVGGPFGATSIGKNSGGPSASVSNLVSTMGVNVNASTSFGVAMLWQ